LLSPTRERLVEDGLYKKKTFLSNKLKRYSTDIEVLRDTYVREIGRDAELLL